MIDKSAKIWEPTIILKHNREIVIGPKCRIGQNCFITPRKLVMEEGATISPLAVLGGGGTIIMRRFSSVNYGAKLIPATFTTNGQFMNDAVMETMPSQIDMVRGSITLEEGAVVGAGAIVCVCKKHPHIIVGEHAVVGALTYVDHDVASFTVVHPVKNVLEKKRIYA